MTNTATKETERRRDDAIRRALNTPPKPHKEVVGKNKGVAKTRKSRVKKIGDKMRFFVLCIVALSLAACASPQIIMRNPTTGQTADCGSRSQMWLWEVASNPGLEESCVHDYQAQGWMRSPN